MHVIRNTDCGSPEHFDSMKEWGRSCENRMRNFNVKLRVAKLRQNSSSDGESVDSIEF